MQKLSIAAIRTAKGWTQGELALKMGVSRCTVNQWERGKREMSPPYLYALCHLTGFSVDDIILPKKTT